MVATVILSVFGVMVAAVVAVVLMQGRKQG